VRGNSLASLQFRFYQTKNGGIFSCSWREVSPYWDEQLSDAWKEQFSHAVRWNAFTSLYFVLDAEVIDERRKEWAKRCDEAKTFQKEFGKQRDAENARFFKQEANEAMKHYRGCCLVLGHLLNNPPGDSPFIRVEQWPLELCDYAVTNMV
jgi:hypothetical protein